MEPEFFTAYEQRYGLPAGYLYRTAQIESGLNPRAQNPRSSAGGLFQFIDSTARQYDLSDRFDPVAATDAAARLARDNAAYLRRRLGREPTAAELYMAHQQGAGGAASLLTGGNRLATDFVSPAAVTLNSGQRDMTAAQFAERIANYYGGSTGASPSQAPVAPQSSPQNALTSIPLSEADHNALAQFMGQNTPQNALNRLGWRSQELDPRDFMSQRRFG